MAVNKDQTIVLAFGERQYKVVTITNSTAYVPGEWLNKPVVDALCKDKNWQVTMAQDQLLQSLFSGVTGRVISTMPLPGV